MLLHHVLEGHCGVFCVLPLSALPTHGGLTRLAVKVHHLRVTQEQFQDRCRWRSAYQAFSQSGLTASPGCRQYQVQLHGRKGKVSFYVPRLKLRRLGLQSCCSGHKTSFSVTTPLGRTGEGCGAQTVGLRTPSHSL